MLSLSSYSFAQLDGSFSSKKDNNSSFGIISNPTKKVEKPKSLDFKSNDGFKTAHTKQQKEYQKKQAEKKLETKGIITPALLRKMTLQKQAEKYSFQIPMIDKEMGTFHTFSKNINIKAYDFGLIDGDAVNIYKNDTLIITNYKLKRGVEKISIPLTIGFNDIEILAIHEGNYRPNTGAFTVYDDDNNIVISDMWSLAKGAKVKALIIRDKK